MESGYVLARVFKVVESGSCGESLESRSNDFSVQG